MNQTAAYQATRVQIMKVMLWSLGAAHKTVFTPVWGSLLFYGLRACPHTSDHFLSQGYMNLLWPRALEADWGGRAWWCLAVRPEPGHELSVGSGQGEQADLKERTAYYQRPQRQTIKHWHSFTFRVARSKIKCCKCEARWIVRDVSKTRGHRQFAARRWRRFVRSREGKFNTNGKRQLMTTTVSKAKITHIRLLSVKMFWLVLKTHAILQTTEQKQ